MMSAYQSPELTGVDLPGIDPNDSEKFEELLIQEALNQKLMTREQVDECFRERQAMESLGARQTIGQICIRRGYLTKNQVEQIMRTRHYQKIRREDIEIGGMAIEKSYASRDQVEECLKVQETAYKQGREIPRLIHILGDRGMVNDRRAVEIIELIHRINQRNQIESDAHDPVEEWSWDRTVRKRQQPRRMVKRGSERFGVPDAYVRLRAGLFDSFKEGENQEAPLIDLSRTGLQFLSRKNLKIGQKVKLEIMVPALTDKLIAKGEVRWIGRAGLTALYRIGVRFVGLSQEISECLDKIASDPFLRAIGRSPYRVYW